MPPLRSEEESSNQSTRGAVVPLERALMMRSRPAAASADLPLLRAPAHDPSRLGPLLSIWTEHALHAAC